MNKWVQLARLPKKRTVDSEFHDLIYWELRDGKIWHQEKLLRSADPDSFEVLSGDHTFLARDHKHVYHAWTQMKKVDRATFEPLGDRYYKDKNHAYTEYETSLRPLKGKPKQFKVLSEGYARDSDYAYYWGTPLRSCTSPLSLKVVRGAGKPASIYARDNQHLYYEGGALKDADLATWKPLPLGFSRDTEHVFHGSEKLPGAKADSWRHLERAYSRDAKNMFVMHFRLKNADPDQWRLVGGSYSTDGKNVYYVGRLISDADAATIKVDKKGKASDKHGAFSGYSRQGRSK